jgi:superfamily II DNA or RNA helicase
VVGPVWARLEAPPEVQAEVREALSIYNPAAEHTWAFKNGRSDGRVQFVSRVKNEFLSGLTWRVASVLVSLGHERPEIRWPNVPERSPLAGALRDMTWRPYQAEAVQKATQARRMVLQCPTSGGKTEIAIEFVRRCGGKTLWLTHTDTLMTQTPQRFEKRLGMEVGVAQGPRESWTDGQVVVGMVQTLQRIARPTLAGKGGRGSRQNPAYDPDWFSQFDVLVEDEVHHGAAETHRAIQAACSNAKQRLGLSGSVGDEVVKLPLVTQLRIEGAYGPTFTVATTMELADLGFVAAPDVVVLRCPPTTYPSYEEVRERVCPDWRDDPRRLLSRLGGVMFREMYERGVMLNEARNQLVIKTAVWHAREGDRFLVLCNRVPHAEAIYQAVRRRAERPAWVLSGEDDWERREAVLGMFKAATDGGVLVCTPFFREGADAPEIDAGFLAGGGESDIAVIQALGRMLRVRPGKSSVTVYDVADGRDQSHLKDYLANHWKSRLDLYTRSGFNVEYR